ncbi:MAG TPA: dihydrodipicolinate synthase family protein [Bryobacteraceae bacterium]|jgi:dihydrodipicolinate synthase/N-acetylneuraminate lyase|nr:dihydrodipicolinate synthase family protein [Bryobacteraceae bacterium]
MAERFRTSNRRAFLRALGSGAASLALAGPCAASTPQGKPLAGVFPIGFSPFTEENKLDLDGLAAEVKFCNRGNVHGFMWPQIASGWTTLSEKERLDGAEAILAAGKGGKTALVIGVQGPDMAAIARYATHAEKLGADAIVSLPPAAVSDEKVLLDFYQQVGRLTPLPLFAQATGTMTVDLLIGMFQTIPTFRQVKDEAGDPLQRVAEIRQRTDGQLKVFSGFGVATMITEMELGFSGHCPYTNLADVYAAAYDLWHAGKKREGFEMFGRIQALSSMMPTNTIDILIARGVFKPGTRTRNGPSAPGAPQAGGGGRRGPRPVTQEEIRRALKTYLEPHLKG